MVKPAIIKYNKGRFFARLALRFNKFILGCSQMADRMKGNTNGSHRSVTGSFREIVVVSMVSHPFKIE